MHVHRHGVRLGHGRGGGSVHSPLTGLALEKFVDGKLKGGAGDGKTGRGGRLVGLEGKRGLAIGHAGGRGRGRAEKCGRTEIGGKNGGKAELLGGAGCLRGGVTRARIVRDVHGIRIVLLVLMFVGVLVGLGTVGGNDPHGVVFAAVVVEVGGGGERLEGLYVGIECKGILHRPHAVLGGGRKWLAVLAVALHLLHTGTDLFRRVCAFKIGGLELGNGPNGWGEDMSTEPEGAAREEREKNAARERRTCLPLSLSSLSLMCFPSFLNSRLLFALSAWTRANWRNQRRQLRFSRRWPCSRCWATFVQTFHVLVSVSLSEIWPRGEKDLFPCGWVRKERG